jgi:hypothetical protein
LAVRGVAGDSAARRRVRVAHPPGQFSRVHSFRMPNKTSIRSDK